MIHHISIAANQPQYVAQVLAQLCQGQTALFPYYKNSYVVLALDPHGTMIEVMPQGTTLTPSFEGDFVSGTKLERSLDTPKSSYNAFHAAISVATSNERIKVTSSCGYNAFHAAISVATSEATIHEIAARNGWHVTTCDRLSHFRIIEVWVENQQLLEFLPPNFAEQYLTFMQPQSLQKFLALPDNEAVEKLLALNSNS